MALQREEGNVIIALKDLVLMKDLKKVKYVVKKDNRRVKYDREKLLRGLTFATVKRNISREELDKIISDIERGLQNSLVSEISSKELGEKVLEKLRDLDQVAYVRFASVYKEFDDIKSFIEIVEQIKKD